VRVAQGCLNEWAYV